jgi:hypothetical protein
MEWRPKKTLQKERKMENRIPKRNYESRPRFVKEKLIPTFNEDLNFKISSDSNLRTFFGIKNFLKFYFFLNETQNGRRQIFTSFILIILNNVK